MGGSDFGRARSGRFEPVSDPIEQPADQGHVAVQPAGRVPEVLVQHDAAVLIEAQMRHSNALGMHRFPRGLGLERHGPAQVHVGVLLQHRGNRDAARVDRMAHRAHVVDQVLPVVQLLERIVEIQRLRVEIANSLFDTGIGQVGIGALEPFDAELDRRIAAGKSLQSFAVGCRIGLGHRWTRGKPRKRDDHGREGCKKNQFHARIVRRVRQAGVNRPARFTAASPIEPKMRAVSNVSGICP